MRDFQLQKDPVLAGDRSVVLWDPQPAMPARTNARTTVEKKVADRSGAGTSSMFPPKVRGGLGDSEVSPVR
jgi:hypothetical protein